jgi:hypothetical protein
LQYQSISICSYHVKNIFFYNIKINIKAIEAVTFESGVIATMASMTLMALMTSIAT